MEIKRKVIEATYGNIFSMLSRPKSTSIIDTVYSSYASSQQKALMRQELFGDLYKKVKTAHPGLDSDQTRVQIVIYSEFLD